MSFPSPIEDDDMLSVASSNSVASSVASSVYETLSNEVDRKKQRLKKFRRKWKKLQNDQSNGEGNDSSNVSGETSSTLTSTSSSGGIMTARTMQESLDGGYLPDMRKMRRKVTIKFKGENLAILREALLEDVSVSPSAMSAISTESAENEEDTSVRFKTVDIREYELVPGQNPYCTSGPPLELGWAHTDAAIYEFDAYENFRDGRRRLPAQMKMPPDARRSLLLRHGSTQKMIREATKAAAKGRNEKKETMDSLLTPKKSSSFSNPFKLLKGKKKK